MWGWAWIFLQFSLAWRIGYFLPSSVGQGMAYFLHSCCRVVNLVDFSVHDIYSMIACCCGRDMTVLKILEVLCTILTTCLCAFNHVTTVWWLCLIEPVGAFAISSSHVFKCQHVYVLRLWVSLHFTSLNICALGSGTCCTYWLMSPGAHSIWGPRSCGPCHKALGRLDPVTRCFLSSQCSAQEDYLRGSNALKTSCSFKRVETNVLLIMGLLPFGLHLGLFKNVTQGLLTSPSVMRCPYGWSNSFFFSFAVRLQYKWSCLLF